MSGPKKMLAALTIVLVCLLLSGCNARVGVGINVGVPIGNHGYMSIGTGRGWY